MQTRNPLFRITAATCFVLLITAFVVYTAGAFPANKGSLKNNTEVDLLKQPQQHVNGSQPGLEDEFLLPVDK